MAKGSDGYSKNNKAVPFELRDYTHASKTFLSLPGYAMSPKFGFGFHARLIFATPGDSQNGDTSKAISVLVKKVDLPKYNIETQTLNKYNQKEIVHKKVNYEPITIVFHDDMLGTIRNMWIAYNDYYNADRGVTPQAWAINDTYANTKLFNRYGLDNNQRPKFIISLDVYSMGNHRYTKYSFINPLIVSLDFDTHDYSDNTKTMEIQARIEYETVLYYEGNTESIPGFGKDSPYYDNKFSTLGSTPIKTSSQQLVDSIESAIKTQTAPQVAPAIVEEKRSLPVQLSPEQIAAFRTVAANSIQALRRFAFPTATSIQNVSSLVDLTPQQNQNQGRIATVGVAVSNGTNINSSPPSNFGIQTTAANNVSSLLVLPNVPAGLTETEKQAFMQAYPPLASTDSRARMPPYV